MESVMILQFVEILHLGALKLHLGALTCVCLLRFLSQLRPDGPNCYFFVNALPMAFPLPF